MRSAQDYACGLGDEAGWNVAPRRFTRLRLLAEDFQVIGQYAGRDALVPDRIAPPRRLVRTHVEGRFSLAADAASLRRFVPLVTGGSWATHGTGAAETASLKVDGSADAMSVSVIRRLADRDRWQLHTGLCIQRLRLFPGGDGGLLMAADCLGAERRDSTAPTLSALPEMKPAMQLAAPPHGLGLGPPGGAVLSPLYLAGVEIVLTRDGMRPHVALAADTPQMITPGRLVARLVLRLLANDAARAASQHDQLEATLTLHGGGKKMTLSFGRLQVTERREIVDASGGPTMIHLGLRAEPGPDGLMQLGQRAQAS